MPIETKKINSESEFEAFKAKYAVNRPESIKEKVAVWAFEGVDTIADVIACLERIDCAACYSPAPVYNHDMAAEVARYWLEIDEARDAYLDATGEQWMPREHGGLLSYLWFAYEWTAHDLASEIRCAIESWQI